MCVDRLLFAAWRPAVLFIPSVVVCLEWLTSLLHEFLLLCGYCAIRTRIVDCYINSGLLYEQWIVMHVAGIADHIGSLSKAISEPCLTDRMSEGRAKEDLCGRASCMYKCFGKGILD